MDEFVARNLKPLLLIVAATQLATGLLMAIDPGTFFEEIGPYGAQNDHYIRDASTFTLALGLVLAIAAFRPSWRPAAIAGALFQLALHAINHLVDIGEAAAREPRARELRAAGGRRRAAGRDVQGGALTGGALR